MAMEVNMGTAIRVSDKLIKRARIASAVEHRSLTGQIEYWARIGRCAEENPELTFHLIKDILTGIEELDAGEGTEYRFG
jgi:hypothetical protein